MNANRPTPGRALLERLTRGPSVIGIVHWGLNTFTGREWGFGDEAPALLAPEAFDADQIVSACKAGGLGGLVVVAKHHDGFCLWPTKTTGHNISKSPFRGGKGDYVREMADACRRAGLKFGIYCSPWDRNSAAYGTPTYTEIYHEQLRELLGGAYGEVFEVWFDGANGGDGFYGGAREKRRIGAASAYYRFGDVFRMVHRLQPNATIFAGERDDSDFRWPGNEMGLLDPDSRATIEEVGGYTDGGYGNPHYKEQINTGSPGGTFFRACECDFPLRKGWFWRESERGTTKSGEALALRYLETVGNGGTMNIGIAPDSTGRLSADDVRALERFGELRQALFARPVASGPANLVELGEDVSLGERVDGWRLSCKGREIARGRAVGARRIRAFTGEEVPEAALLRAEATAFAGTEAPEICVAAYRADSEVLRAVLSAAGQSVETDTANWMTGASDQSSAFDVCVVGGSCTGVFAAASAAAAGMRVALIERNYFLGGTATAGFVPVWHSLFSLDGSRRIVGGYTQQVIERLAAKGLATLHDAKDGRSESVYCYFNTAALQSELDRMVQESGVRTFFGANFVAAEVDRPGHVARVVIEDKSGRRTIAAKFFVDCSGDGDLVERAGFETWKPPREQLQAHTLCALVTGVERLRKMHPNFSFDELMKPSSGARLNHVFQWWAPVPGCPETTFIAATRVAACDPTDADDLTNGMFEARGQLGRIVAAANRVFPTDGPGLQVAAVAPELGLRESRHLCGLYRVTGEDVLYGREYPDVIAKGTYRVDIHEGKGIKFRYLDGREWEMVQDLATGEIKVRRGRWRPEGPNPECYQVPYRAIVPKGSENVLCAGRMVDADREAYGALRVMVNCNQMGEAAGAAAAKAVKEHLAAPDAYPGFVSAPA